MDQNKYYTLPELPYGYAELQPYISEEQLKLHHTKHHQAYVNNANALLQKMEKAREENTDLDAKAILKDLSFQVGGHLLHALFWPNLAPAGKGGGKPKGSFASALEKEFGGFERFRKEFSQAAASAEGSGWAALTLEHNTNRLLVMQIEKHNENIYPGIPIILLLDVWEHAYYLDYKNDRAKFIEAFWNLVNWSEVEKRFKNL